jgi:hypothetical protein
MQTISLQPIPSQQVQCSLAGQNCQISVYLRGTNLYVDLTVNGTPISYGVIAHNFVSLVPTGYLGFSGTLAFMDTQQGNSDPQFAGLGNRWVLLYLTAADFAQMGAA